MIKTVLKNTIFRQDKSKQITSLALEKAKEIKATIYK